VHWPGMMSTPEIAFLTRNGPFSAGIAITASHNLAADNGIKVFGSDGRKLDRKQERQLERAVLSGRATGAADAANSRYGWLQLSRERRYEDFIVRTFRKSFATIRKRPLSVVFDCAFGARSIDLEILSLLARSVAFGRTRPEFRIGQPMVAGGKGQDNALDICFLNAASPTRPEDHHRINDGVGALHPEGCAEAVRRVSADIGVCFDGDGDRCILVDENGEIRDGDYILALLAADMKTRGVLKGNKVVSTVMANLGLSRALASRGIELVSTEVGDRHVSAAMEKHGATLGGEQSGHIIVADEGHIAGDGLYTALRVIEVMLDTDRPLSELCHEMVKCPQVLLNLKVARKPALGSLKKTKAAIREAERKLGSGARLLVRYSGTEPLLRIMIEGDDQKAIQSAANSIAKAARREVGV